MLFENVEMPANARVWVYTCDRMLTEVEQSKLHETMRAFTDRWTAHGARMSATHLLLHDSVLILIADEQKAMASGCSIDDSVKEIKALGASLGVDFFNRHRVVYLDENNVWQNKGVADFWALRKAGVVHSQSKLINPLCNSWAQVVDSIELPFEKTWHQEMWAR